MFGNTMVSLVLLCTAVMLGSAIPMPIIGPLLADAAVPTVSLSIVPESTPEPREGDMVILRCDIVGYSEAYHTVRWTRFYKGSVSETVIASNGALHKSVDHRLFISRIHLLVQKHSEEVAQITSAYVQRLVINPVQERDESVYRCQLISNNNTDSTADSKTKTVAYGEAFLTVYLPELFPVCFPNGPAPLVEGDTVFCGTLAKDRYPVVNQRGAITVADDTWTMGLRRDGGAGSEMKKSVTVDDVGLTFDCWSIPTNAEHGNPFTCVIGPLTADGVSLMRVNVVGLLTLVIVCLLCSEQG